MHDSTAALTHISLRDTAISDTRERSQVVGDGDDLQYHSRCLFTNRRQTNSRAICRKLSSLSISLPLIIDDRKSHAIFSNFVRSGSCDSRSNLVWDEAPILSYIDLVLEKRTEITVPRVVWTRSWSDLTAVRDAGARPSSISAAIKRRAGRQTAPRNAANRRR